MRSWNRYVVLGKKFRTNNIEHCFSDKRTDAIPDLTKAVRLRDEN